jgi:SAM-dependent methyltransferase
MDKRSEQELLAIVKNNYEEIAADFSQTRKRKLWPPLIEIAKQAGSGSRVLDVGCGNGRLRQAWLNNDVEYVGIEPSSKLLELAEKIEEWRLPSQKFLIGDILSLHRLDVGTFDEVYCIAVIHHLPGKKLREQALEALLEKVKPGGRLIITTWSMWQHMEFVRAVIKGALLKLLGLNRLDFGDIVFPGFNQKSPRYYHAFTGHGFKSLMRSRQAQLEAFIFDKRNYYAVLRKQ